MRALIACVEAMVATVAAIVFVGLVLVAVQAWQRGDWGWVLVAGLGAELALGFLYGMLSEDP